MRETTPIAHLMASNSAASLTLESFARPALLTLLAVSGQPEVEEEETEKGQPAEGILMQKKGEAGVNHQAFEVLGTHVMHHHLLLLQCPPRLR